MFIPAWMIQKPSTSKKTSLVPPTLLDVHKALHKMDFSYTNGGLKKSEIVEVTVTSLRADAVPEGWQMLARPVVVEGMVSAEPSAPRGRGAPKTSAGSKSACLAVKHLLS